MSTLPRWLRGDVGAATGVAVGSVALAGIAFELWNADLDLPLSDARGDVTFIEALVKAILDHGWFLSNPDLGAPVGQHIHDMVNFSASNLQFAVIWAIGLFSSDPATVLNLYFLLGFALVGVAAFLVMRRLGVSAWPAAVCALLFSVLPDHFLRGEGHLTLATYFPVPIGAYLALAVATDRPLFERRAAPGRRPLAWLSRLTAITLALCAVVAVADLYYAVFTVLLIAVAAAFRALADLRWAPLATGGVAIGAIALVFVVNLAPNLLYVAEHGRNPATDRDPIESELFGLTVGRLVLPDAGHRSETLAEVGNEYRGPTAIGERNPRPGDPLGLSVNNYIGMIAVAGLALLLAVALASLLGRPRGLLADPRLRAASALSVASILVATAGGISIVVAFLVTPQIRSWNRISVVIAFLALLAVAVLLDSFRERAESRRRGRLLFGGALAAVLALGFLDQTNPGIPPDAAALRAERDSTEALVDEIERRIPDGEVLQLPHQTGFPDSSTLGAAFYYDSLNPYLFSEGLSWSGNPMEGRPPEDWARSLQGAPARLALASGVAAGFDGVLVDRLADQAFEGRTERDLSPVLGAPVESADGRYAFYELGSARERLLGDGAADEEALREAVIEPPAIDSAPGFYPEETLGGVRFRWGTESAAISIDNPSDEERSLVLEAIAYLGAGRPAPLRIETLSGTRTVTIDTGGTRLRLPFRAGPGLNRISFSIEAAPTTPTPPDNRTDLVFRLADYSLGDARVAVLSERLEGSG